MADGATVAGPERRRRLLVIGVGPGAVDQVTVEAVAALRSVDVFLIIDKGDAKADLVRARTELLRAHAPAGLHRIVDVPDTVRDPTLPYAQGVRVWHRARLERLEHALLALPPGQCAGIMVWGDPSLYDSTIRLVDELQARGNVAFDHEVIAGVSSVQLLAARHRIGLNRIGGSVLITTGRAVTGGAADDVDDVVVMLDAGLAFRRFVGRGYDIYWAAHLGSADERLVAGHLDDVAEEITRVRAETRAAKGWMFDIYLLRRRPY